MAKLSRPAPAAADNEPEDVSVENEANMAPVSRPPDNTIKPTVVKSSTKRKMPRWAWIAGGAGVIIAAALVGWLLMGRTSTPTAATTTNHNTNSTAQLVPRVLDGVLVPADQANPTVIAAMIENIKESRPPSGLDKASVVYEALAEGGITRFLALFPAGQDLKEIGPIRSARPYYISWAEEYAALYLHAGGSPQALSYLKSGHPNVADFNQFSHAPNFIRDHSRPAPHNLYTNSFLIGDALNKLKLPAPTYTSWTFKQETALDQRPTSVNDLVIDFSSFNYRVKYVYDRVNNRYTRFVADQPHVTRDGSQIFVDNIVVEFMTTGLIPGEKQRLDLQTVGTGKLLMFRDGTAVQGTWKKDSNSGRTEFLDQDGKALALNPGMTWIEAVPTDRKVTY